MPQCFAYSMTGQRCEFDAGHEGLHGLTVVWSDADCFTPVLTDRSISVGGPSLADVAAKVEWAIPQPDEFMPGAEPTSKCESCEHESDMHPGGACIACDCKNFIG